MLKVMRVSNGKGVTPNCPIIEIGDIVTPIETRMFPNGPYYQFAEYPPKKVGNKEYVFFYNARNFATLPEQSADEMQEQNHEAIIYQRQNI